jgi:putative phosphoesterase
MIALVADSHGAVDRLEQVLETCNKNGWIMAHAGDGIVDGLPELFEKFPKVKVYYARGNADMDDDLIKAVLTLPNVNIANVVTFKKDGQTFGVSHFEGEAEKLLKNKKIDVWLHGHTHRTKAERNEDGSVVINPGALFEDGKYILWNPETGRGERVFFNYETP